MKKIYPLCLILTFVLFTTSCIKEDFSDCPAGLKVFFTYTPLDGNIGMDPSKVDKLNLYIFDEETGLLKAMVEDVKPTLSPDYYMQVYDLPAGKYKMIAWGDVYGDYQAVDQNDRIDLVVNQTTYNEAFLEFIHKQEVTTPIGYLFHAQLDGAEVVDNVREQRFYVPMVEITNTFNVTSEGLGINNRTYSIWIVDNNGRYKFDSSFAEDSKFKYYTTCDKDIDRQPFASLRVLKLAADRKDVQFVFHDDTYNMDIYTADLIELLNLRGVDYETQHIFDIHIKFGKDLGVSVSVDGWQVVDGEITDPK